MKVRATLRLAWRQLRRARGSSALVALLIALPVAGASAALTFIESRTPTAQQQVDLELGDTQSWIQIAGGPDPSRRQAVDAPYVTEVALTDDGAPVHPEQDPPTDLRAARLPAGTQTIPLALFGAARMKTTDGIAGFSVVAGDAWDPRLTGRYEKLDGRFPRAADEALASPALLERLGTGDEAVFVDESRRYRIVGTMRARDGGAGPPEMLFVPMPADLAADQLTWFLPDWQPDAAELENLNHAGYVAYARDLVLDPPRGTRTFAELRSDESRWMLLAVGTIAFVFTGVLVALLSAAAMAVSARRQQRSLAVLTTVGARPGDVFRTVLAQGALLGLTGGGIGGAVGISGAAAALAVMDPGVKNTFWSSWGLKVPWLIIPVVVFAILIGVVASLLPARSATRGDAVAALRGARRPVVMSLRQPVWGIVITVSGAVAIVAGGLSLAALNSHRTWNDLQLVALWTVIGGVLLLLLGVIVTGQGILTLLARLLPVLGTAPRLASRDAVANSSRTVPAFVAIAASASVAAFVLSAVAMTGAQNDRRYAWEGPPGSVIVDGWGDAAGHTPGFLATAQPQRVIAIAAPREPEPDADGQVPDSLPPAVSVDYRMDAPEGDGPSGWSATYGQPPVVIDAEDLEPLTGLDLSGTQLREFAAGGILATSAQNVDSEGMISLSFWDPPQLWSTETPEPLRQVELSAQVHADRSLAWPVILSPVAADDLGLSVVTTHWVGLFDSPPSNAVRDRLRADAETAQSEAGSYGVHFENGPDPSLPWLTLILGAAGVLVVAASAISLGLARIERREDDATLAAVGATARLRRAVGAWQALIIAGVGCLLGTAIGIAGAWALVQATTPYLQLSDLPAGWLAALAIGLPSAIALVALSYRPPRAVLTRRTAIA